MIEVYFDGSCGPMNPGGDVGYGVLIRENGRVMCELAGGYTPPVGREKETSNNVGEYLAVVMAMKNLLDRERNKERVTFFGDSNLVIMQMTGKWRIKKGFYVQLALEARRLATQFPMISFQWIPRERNESADELSRKDKVQMVGN